MENTYILSMRSHIKQLESELNGLADIAKRAKLGRYEYRAAERTLQITIEAAIGIAKHWCKAQVDTAPANAYQAFELLGSLGIPEIDTTPWREIIGMRNALVHDYLNIDREIVEMQIAQQRYLQITAFAMRGLTALEET